MNNVVRTTQGLYRTKRAIPAQELIEAAKQLVSEGFHRTTTLSSPAVTRDFLTLELAQEEREVFGVIFADSQHRVLSFERMFQGSIGSTTVHPREVVKRSLELNAAAVIFAHNHPSGHAEPSTADRQITARLNSALELVDVRVLDHMVVGGKDIVSFAERGWL